MLKHQFTAKGWKSRTNLWYVIICFLSLTLHSLSFQIFFSSLKWCKDFADQHRVFYCDSTGQYAVGADDIDKLSGDGRAIFEGIITLFNGLLMDGFVIPAISTIMNIPIKNSQEVDFTLKQIPIAIENIIRSLDAQAPRSQSSQSFVNSLGKLQHLQFIQRIKNMVRCFVPQVPALRGSELTKIFSQRRICVDKSSLSMSASLHF